MKLQRKKGPDGLETGSYFIVRRRPKRYESVEHRKLLWISLHTDSLTEARKKAPGVWDNVMKSWEARLAGDTSQAEARYNAARDLAKSYGFDYLPIEQARQLPLEQIIERVERAHDGSGKPNLRDAEALLGIVEKPTLKVSKALEEYWPLARDLILGKSEDQVRRWRNPRKKAFKNFIKVCGNPDLSEITRDMMLDFREWLMDRVVAGIVTSNTANKDLIHFCAVIRLINRKKRLKLNLPFEELSISEGEARTRPAFSTSWIRDKILAPGALKGLNTQARVILLGMINTGYRPSEACVLGPDQIVLDHDVPHISIEPIGRTLKTRHARRLIPLLGVSLEAFKECPDGFPRYFEKANVSSTLTKFLRENKLLETEDHVCYSLRHSFQSRMIEADVDDRIRRDVFGHRLTEDRYGEVALEKVREVLKPVAL
ncbi:tyrosine-type recombinase/integrase [uncultured Roseobacter sp.]|uniref:phage integrase SAM-like domain-containing protein n=1 Tax=uncultured Roseobacter sp. TaxID=114847 RepID=UPI002629B0BA|nr:tyrosine-type recombinase/integrase [uncultured Roseobacter sp.]